MRVAYIEPFQVKAQRERIEVLEKEVAFLREENTYLSNWVSSESDREKDSRMLARVKNLVYEFEDTASPAEILHMITETFDGIQENPER